MGEMRITQRLNKTGRLLMFLIKVNMNNGNLLYKTLKMYMLLYRTTKITKPLPLLIFKKT